MVNKKELEVLNEILLRMSYDLGKTLNENKSLLKEGSIPYVERTDRYYYNSSGQLNLLPQSATEFPEGSTPAEDAYPGIKKGSEFPRYYQERPKTYLPTRNPSVGRSTTLPQSDYKPVWDGTHPKGDPYMGFYADGTPVNGIKLDASQLKAPEPTYMSFDEFIKNRGIDLPYRSNVQKMTRGGFNTYKDQRDWQYRQSDVIRQQTAGIFKGPEAEMIRKSQESDNEEQDYKDREKRYLGYFAETPEEHEAVKSYENYLDTQGRIKPSKPFESSWNPNCGKMGDKKMTDKDSKGYPCLGKIVFKSGSQKYDYAAVSYWYRPLNSTYFKSYDSYFEAMSPYNEDLALWWQNFGQFEKQETEGSGTLHSILMWSSIILTAAAFIAGSVATGGIATPAFISMASRVGLALDLFDGAIYLAEGNPRDAVLTFTLGAVDAGMLVKELPALRSINTTKSEINQVKNIIRKNKNSGKSFSQLRKEGKLTDKQFRIGNEIASGKYANDIVRLSGKSTMKLAIHGAKEFALNSPKNFLSYLVSFYKNPILKTTGLIKTVGGLAIVLDGVNYSYNTIYNAISGEDQEVKSLILSLINSFWPEVQSQVEENNVTIEEALEGLDFSIDVPEDVTFDMASARELMDDINEKNLTPEEIEFANSYLSNKLNKNNLKSTGFKSKEEGDKFRVWFNKIAPSNSKLIDLDLTGPHDNSYIRAAYWTKMSDGKTYGDIYKELPVSGNDENNNDTMM
jgi:hypothetical protein